MRSQLLALTLGQCLTVWKALWASPWQTGEEHWIAEQRKIRRKNRKQREKETINNLIVIRVLESKPKTDLYQRKYYADHFHTHTKCKQQYAETRSQFLNKCHSKCASSDGKQTKTSERNCAAHYSSKWISNLKWIDAEWKILLWTGKIEMKR